MNGTPIAQQLRESIDKCYYMKLKNFCTGKDSHQTEEIAYRMEENLCQLYL
jgi:hypothetical protein